MEKAKEDGVSDAGYASTLPEHAWSVLGRRYQIVRGRGGLKGLEHRMGRKEFALSHTFDPGRNTF